MALVTAMMMLMEMDECRRWLPVCGSSSTNIYTLNKERVMLVVIVASFSEILIVFCAWPCFQVVRSKVRRNGIERGIVIMIPFFFSTVPLLIKVGPPACSCLFVHLPKDYPSRNKIVTPCFVYLFVVIDTSFIVPQSLHNCTCIFEHHNMTGE